MKFIETKGWNSTAAVVVTHNRLPLLKRVLASLREQTVALDELIVVNNGSTDGTGEWLAGEKGLSVLEQDNRGGAGGFYAGVQAAYERGHDWIWIMDDDVVARPDCLEKLLGAQEELAFRMNVGAVLPARVQGGGYFVTEGRINVTNPFRELVVDKLRPSEVGRHRYVEVEACTFEGLFLRRDVVSEVGFPNPDYFLLYDDTDFSFRIVRKGFKVVLCVEAQMERIGDPAVLKAPPSWRYYYDLRNRIFFDRVHATPWVKVLRPAQFILRSLFLHLRRRLAGVGGFTFARLFKVSFWGFTGRMTDTNKIIKGMGP